MAGSAWACFGIFQGSRKAIAATISTEAAISPDAIA